MSFSLTINKKPVIFKSGVRMTKQLDKLNPMTYSMDGAEIRGLSGVGSSIINQFISLVGSDEEIEVSSLLSVMSILLFAMQKEVSQDEIDDFLDSIDSDEELSSIVQKVYDELPKGSKKLGFSSKTSTATLA